MTRECDNDDCDYETYVNEAGQGAVRWDHVAGCGGLVQLPRPDLENPRPGSFLEFLLKNS